jgi:hypothetical protein
MIRYILMVIAVVLAVCACSSSPQVTTQMMSEVDSCVAKLAET